ncbi:hypothetical protein B0J17DRAFT_717077 [Rhizoctonia solani]|nr:hypothetical protein B0J17DRAFT_717077 [Rhizoctonia solani]
MLSTTINYVISNNAAFKQRSNETMKMIPPVSDELTHKHHWLQGMVRNATDFGLNVLGSYLDSGRYDQLLGFLGMFDLGTFTAFNGDGTDFTGVGGGQHHRVKMDEDHSFDFCIGFTNPSSGSYKAGIVASSNPKDAYDASKAEGGYIESGLYEAKDTDGKTVQFKFHITAGAGQHSEYQITMIRHSE